MIDEILERFDLRYEDLEPQEVEVLNTWTTALEKGSLSVSKVREYVRQMKRTTEQALIEEPEFHNWGLIRIQNRKQIYLKARLKNLLLLDAMLSNPERARKEMERAIAGFASRVKNS